MMKLILAISLASTMMIGCSSSMEMTGPVPITHAEIQEAIISSSVPARRNGRRGRVCVSAGHAGGYSCNYTSALAK